MGEKHPNSLSREQKTGFVLLLIFGVLAVGLGFFQIRNNIYGPFINRTAKADDGFAAIDEQTRLQMIDTDQDGLNDFEELTFYETSRYLPDTDSDGIDDKTEIDEGTNPLCPEGEACEATEFIDTSTTTDIFVSPLAEEARTPLDVIGQADFVEAGSAGTIDLSSIINDPAKLRELLVSTGQVPQDVLDGIDDETLLQMAKESMGEQEGSIEVEVAQ